MDGFASLAMTALPAYLIGRCRNRLKAASEAPAPGARPGHCCFAHAAPPPSQRQLRESWRISKINAGKRTPSNRCGRAHERHASGTAQARSKVGDINRRVTQCARTCLDGKAIMEDFDFTYDWFGSNAEVIWRQLLPAIKPKKVLEIGSFEGRSTTFLMQYNDWCDDLEIYCVDSWEGSIEHTEHGLDMKKAENKFDKNISIAKRKASRNSNITKLKGFSDSELPKLLADNKCNYFDFIYVDGSHQAADVLLDAVLAFKLCRVGGVIGFDDYTWSEDLPYGKNLLRCPKLAIDAFTTIFAGKIAIINTPVVQIYAVKKSD
jgi:predicted O-methyltransferase YrrM